MTVLIAQQTAQDASAQILWILGIVVVLAVVLGVVAWIVRKITLGSDDDAATPGLTLSDLRQMHREGQMTDEEFEAAKRLVVAQGLSMMSEPSPGASADDVSDASGGEAGDNPPADSDKNDGGDASSETP